MSQSSVHSARLHAATAALCALLLLVALCVMALHHAPWWALGGVQGVLLAATASAGLWVDRALGERRAARAGHLRGLSDPLWWADLERAQTGRQRRFRAGALLPEDDDDVFWQERMPRTQADQGKEQ